MPGLQATLDEWKHGTLRSSSGQKVTSQKQALAIGFSEDRRAGKDVPPAPRHRRPHSIGRALGDTLKRSRT